MATESPTKWQVIALLNLEIFLIALYIFFTEYSDTRGSQGTLTAVQTYYPMFQDVHVMIFVGFGFLMTFLKRYGYSSVSFNLLVAAMLIQWAILCIGFFDLNRDNKIEISMSSLLEADVAAAAVLISMGAVLGKTTYLQLIIMGFIEILVYVANKNLALKIFRVADAGESMFVHVMGAYFGLAVSITMRPKKDTSVSGNNLEGASYSSDLFSMIGTVFLWMFWPSFNSAALSGSEQHRAVINTYLSLAACCVTAMATSALVSSERRFEMAHVQNSTLAGGVAVGTACNLMIQPYGALIIGSLAGVLSVIGFRYIQPWLLDKLRLHDTCGVNNLHGMPGIMAGLIGALMAAIASESNYVPSEIYSIWPARAPPAGSPDALDTFKTAQITQYLRGENRSAYFQGLYQLLALGVTLVVAIVSGFITGFIIKNAFCSNISEEHRFDDEFNWHMPEGEEETKSSNHVTSDERTQNSSV